MHLLLIIFCLLLVMPGLIIDRDLKINTYKYLLGVGNGGFIKFKIKFFFFKLKLRLSKFTIYTICRISKFEGGTLSYIS